MYEIKKVGGGVCAPAGFFADGVSAGLKPGGAKDVAFVHADVPCETAAVFTTNRMTAAPIRHFRAKGDFKTNFIHRDGKVWRGSIFTHSSEVRKKLKIQGIIVPA